MTTLQVHLIMLALGITAFFLLAGIFRKQRAHYHSRRPWKSILAGVAIAASPLSKFWRHQFNPSELFIQSLLISAIAVLTILLFALISMAFQKLARRRRRRKAHAIEREDTQLHDHEQRQERSKEESLPALMIDADDHSTNEQPATPTVNAFHGEAANSSVGIQTNNSSVDTEPMFDRATYHDPLRTPDSSATNVETMDKSREKPFSNSAASLSEGTDGKDDAIDQLTVDVNDVLLTNADPISATKMDERLSGFKAANDQTSEAKSTLAEEELITPTMPLDNDNLDLSGTDKLFAEMRSERSELNLPDDQELHDATQKASMPELDLDDDVVNQKVELSSEPNTARIIDSEAVVIEEAEVLEDEVVDKQDTNLDFGNDVTGAYAHPIDEPTSNEERDTAEVVTETPVVEEVPIPSTLDDALIAAKKSASSVQTKLSNLENSLGEFDTFRTQQIDTASKDIEVQQSVLEHKDALLASEDEARRAAESMIATQSAILDRTRREKQLATSLLLKERETLAKEKRRVEMMALEVERSRKMARNAAKLARKAAVAQQAIRDVAKREQHARLKSQESTRKAVSIARNAISALAAEERKHEHASH